MSNYHYNDHSGCKTCLEKGGYSSLANTTYYSCDQPCICRFTSERSAKDRAYYDFYVLGKPMDLNQPQNNEQAYMNCAAGPKYSFSSYANKY